MEQIREIFFKGARKNWGRWFTYASVAAVIFGLGAASAQATTHKKKSGSSSSSSSHGKSSSSSSHGSSHSSSGTHSSGKRTASSGSRSSGKHSSSSGKRGSSKKGSKTGGRGGSVVKEAPTDIPLQSENYPKEISGRIGEYNRELAEVKDISKKDPKMAKARGDVLRFKKESFEVYTTFMSSQSGRDADKIRQAVSQQGWFRGMPQIAFIASKGLPDDIHTVHTTEGDHLDLIYNSVGTYHFEKSSLRSFDKATR